MEIRLGVEPTLPMEWNFLRMTQECQQRRLFVKLERLKLMALNPDPGPLPPPPVNIKQEMLPSVDFQNPVEFELDPLSDHNQPAQLNLEVQFGEELLDATAADNPGGDFQFVQFMDANPRENFNEQFMDTNPRDNFNEQFSLPRISADDDLLDNLPVDCAPERFSEPQAIRIDAVQSMAVPGISASPITIKQEFMDQAQSCTDTVTQPDKPQRGPEFFCKYCNREYAHVHNARRHEIVVHGHPEDSKKTKPEEIDDPDFLLSTDKSKCRYCKKKFESKYTALRHEKIFHQPEKPFICGHCNEGFWRRKTLDAHVVTHVSEDGTISIPQKKRIRNIPGTKQNWPCRTCGKEFAYKFNLDEHERVHTGEKPFRCKICKKGFRVRAYLKIHEKRHTGQKRFSCQYCQRGFTQKYACIKHEATHSRQRYTCEFCQKEFFRENTLKEHLAIHTSEKLFECKYCSKKFFKNKYLVLHERRHEINGGALQRRSRESGTNHRTMGSSDVQQQWICHICNKEFSSRLRLKCHVRIHSTEKRFRCRHCDKAFRVKSVCQKHEGTHTKPLFKCEFCQKKFYREVTLKEHIFIHNKEKQFACKICGWRFRRSNNHMKHEKLHESGLISDNPAQVQRSMLPEELRSCPVCPKKFRHEHSLVKHMRIHTGEKPFVCPHCPKGFRLKEYLTAHIRSHTGEKPFVCSYCQKGFRLKKYLATHIRCHTGEKPFKCSLCGKSFRLNHVRKIHEKKCAAMKFKCENCNMRFDSEVTLKEHVYTHTGVPQFLCQICGKTYIKIVNLRTHEATHVESVVNSNSAADKMTSIGNAIVNTNNTFACIPCGKEFSTQHNLEQHVRLHTGEKPFVCKFCKKGFRLKHYLNVHEKLHTTEKSYICRYCPKAFRTSAELVVHERLHTGETPYQCKYCSKGFRSKSACDIHQVRHMKPLFKCEHCDKRFSRKYYLIEHSYVHTKERPFACQFCGRKFKKRAYLRVHEQRYVKSGNPCAPLRAPAPEVILPDSEGNHEVILDSQEKWICLTCNKEFKYHHQLKLHNFVHTGERPFHCRFCDKSFRTRNVCYVHERAEHTNIRFTCPICNKQFRRASSLSAHKQIHLKPTPQRTFIRNENGEVHSEGQDDPRRAQDADGNWCWKCQTCQKLFKFRVYLNAHESIHTGIKPFSCQFCQRKFRTKKLCQAHEARHANPNFKPQKPWSTVRKAAGHYNTHLSYESDPRRVQNSEGKWVWICQTCQKPFKFRMSLNTHESIHTGVKPFNCQFCQKAFRTKHLCEAHEARHAKANFCPRLSQNSEGQPEQVPVENDPRRVQDSDGNWSWVCQTCQKPFKFRVYLNAHESIHTGVKPFNCQMCNKAFRTKKLCQTHEARHSKPNFCPKDGGSAIKVKEPKTPKERIEDPRRVIGTDGKSRWVCPTCNKEHYSKYSLDTHELIHTGETPFKCEQCGKGFRSKHYLQNHEATHLKKKRPRLSCQDCGKVFKGHQFLKMHSQIHQRERGEEKMLVRHKCNICQIEFPHKITLAEHLLIHGLSSREVYRLRRGSLVPSSNYICNTSFGSTPLVHLNRVPDPVPVKVEQVYCEPIIIKEEETEEILS